MERTSTNPSLYTSGELIIPVGELSIDDPYESFTAFFHSKVEELNKREVNLIDPSCDFGSPYSDDHYAICPKSSDELDNHKEDILSI